MRFTKLRPDTFERLQLNAGILIGDTPAHYLQDEKDSNDEHVFDTLEKLANATYNDLLGATTGGITFEATPEYTDFGEDIDNCPANMKELKRLDSWEVTMGGTFVMCDPSLVARLIGSADIVDTDAPSNKTMYRSCITPRDLAQEDFINVWWIGDYGSDNSEPESANNEGGGYLAIHMYNALSTGGFHFTSADGEKGTFEFEFTAHYSMEEQDMVPFTVYIGSGNIEDPV